ncbi:MAG: DUF3592 domain-containing protein [Pseudomonadota bacterium]
MAIDSGLSWAFAAAGVFMEGVAIQLSRRPIRLLRAGGSVRGTVVDCEESLVGATHGPARMFYFPIIRFTTPRGENITFTSNAGRRTAIGKESEVRVIFDPSSPHDAELATFRTLWLFPVITAVFGLPFLAVGVIGLL